MAKSLRDRLKNRPRPTVDCQLRVEDIKHPTKVLEDANINYRMAQMRNSDPDTVESLRKDVDVAQRKLDSCYLTLTLTALKPSDFEALIAQHPAREGTEDATWNTDTFPKACFMACAPTDLSPEEWDDFLEDNCSDGEREALYHAALVVNVRAPERTVPKDLTRTQG